MNLLQNFLKYFILQINGIAFSPKVFMIDKSDTEILAINIFYKEQKVLIFLCFFHYMQAWERWCRNSANGISLDVRPTVIAFVRKLKLVITIEGFSQLEQDFIKWILTTNNLTKLLFSYYKKEWQSCQQLWANNYKPKFDTGWMVNETNNLIERFFSVNIKVEIFAWKEKKKDRHANINQCSDFFTIRFYTQINQQIFNEKKFNEIKSRELKACEIAENNMVDIIDPMNGYCIVKSQSNSSKVYEVYLCDGSYCNCQDQSSLLVKHIRAAASVLGGLEIWNLSLDSERIAFYQNNNMMQDQYTLNSNTANQFHEETPDQKLEDLKIIIQRIQNIPNTDNGIEIKKRARRKGESLVKMWVSVEVELKEKKLTNLQLHGLLQATQESQNYASTLNRGALNRLEDVIDSNKHKSEPIDLKRKISKSDASQASMSDHNNNDRKIFTHVLFA
ncbi:hypothetical protein RhiirA4_467811 [Rhizophagus irregularis]|uniref:MULE transposase domain-containing protein n=1 Tax=Rhizophagus irregularis TaxID=588596 RepID=A0A2I1GWJ9_9GLOM|nr:hypothetical protein RhiirA4_467811 [Rhizophagus irregularis]